MEIVRFGQLSLMLRSISCHSFSLLKSISCHWSHWFWSQSIVTHSHFWGWGFWSGISFHFLRVRSSEKIAFQFLWRMLCLVNAGRLKFSAFKFVKLQLQTFANHYVWAMPGGHGELGCWPQWAHGQWEAVPQAPRVVARPWFLRLAHQGGAHWEMEGLHSSHQSFAIIRLAIIFLSRKKFPGPGLDSKDPVVHLPEN